MTDEEKAKEYCKNSKDFVKYTSETYRGRLKKAYLDGLAEGRKEGYEQGYEDCRHYAHDYYKPKWHDLRKNPNDLPKENGKYIIHIKVSEKRTITDTCDFFNGYFGQYIKPIAWCELPKFEE